MGTRIAIVGTGAIGGYVGAHMIRAGEDVTLIDMWPEHVAAMREGGLRLTGTTPEEAFTIPVKALHVGDVQSLSKERPFDVAFISPKSYDTEWMTALIEPYLAPDGFAVSLQNCINEERIAGVVGWGKTLGAVVSHLGVDLYEPGRVKRTVGRGGEKHTVYRVGEVHGGKTARAEEVVRLLRLSDSGKLTDNLWGERWSKLVQNSSSNGLSAATGLRGNQHGRDEVVRWVRIRVASEAIRVGQALGYRLVEMLHMEPERIARAGEGDPDCLAEITANLLADAASRSDGNVPSTAQDIAKGRRTESEFINGYVAAKGAEAGVPTPINARIYELIRRIERNELTPSVENVKGL